MTDNDLPHGMSFAPTADDMASAELRDDAATRETNARERNHRHIAIGGKLRDLIEDVDPTVRFGKLDFRTFGKLAADAVAEVMSIPADPVAAVLMKVIEHIEANGGALVIGYSDRRGWTLGYEFGAEDPDSPMVGGAAYGMGDAFAEALAIVAMDLGITPPPPESADA
jgi:hypothetical protein